MFKTAGIKMTETIRWQLFFYSSKTSNPFKSSFPLSSKEDIYYIHTSVSNLCWRIWFYPFLSIETSEVCLKQNLK